MIDTIFILSVVGFFCVFLCVCVKVCEWVSFNASIRGSFKVDTL